MDQSNSTMADSFPKFTRALVREIPDSIRDHSEAIEEDLEHRFVDAKPWLRVNVARAREEHECYAQTLRDQGLEVTVLPADESTPDCPFVEDTCVVVGNRALVTRPWGEARRRELDCVEECLKNFGLEVNRIHDEKAILEGGDVVFTGKEFFVGKADFYKQSNTAGHEALANMFPDYPVHIIPLDWPEFHLKGVLCSAGPGVLALARNKRGKKAWKTVQSKSAFTYEPVWLPEAKANLIHVNGTVIHCTDREAPNSMKVFKEKLAGFKRVAFRLRELSKLDAGLTCCSILF